MQSDERLVSWSYTPAESPVLRALAHLPFAVVSGMALLGVGGAAWLGASSVLRGEYASAFGILFVLLIAGGLFAVRSEPLFGDERRRQRGFDFDLNPRWVLVGSLISVGVLLAAIVTEGLPFPVLLGLLFGAMVVPSVVAGLLTSKGELDVDAGTLRYNRREVELSALTNARRFAVGGVVFYRLSHADGSTSFGTPRFLVIPSNADAAVRDAVTAGRIGGVRRGEESGGSGRGGRVRTLLPRIRGIPVDGRTELSEPASGRYARLRPAHVRRFRSAVPARRRPAVAQTTRFSNSSPPSKRRTFSATMSACRA